MITPAFYGRTVLAMTMYLVECYLSREDAAGIERGEERTRRAADELSSAGMPVRHLLSLFVPQDETCFLLYQAASVEAVREAARRADLSVDRIAEVHATLHGEAQLQCPNGGSR